ncbi:methyl-accepting chemotaxis protein [Yoonia sp. SDW83-1]|uniref:methyl-accepting chemotaxis protein n=1 Tax=Yoonia sp. SDW83-1 TaxID=3366945 RepID=UPI00398C2A65
MKSAASSAKEIEGIVVIAQGEADESGPVVRNAVSAINEIEKSLDEIKKIIGVIDDIAFQTNLLALNAGVEAARAGEAGRGFAVVASEVRALAQRSSDAAKQIKGLIGGSSERVQNGVSLVGHAGEVLTKIVDRISQISSLMSGIAAGAQEQSTGLGEINIGMSQLDQVTQQNAAMVEEATAGSHALNQDAQKLADMVSRFRLKKGSAYDQRD